MTLRAENLSLRYHNHIVINDLAIEMKRGDMTTILGPNGCGKSTFLKALARLVKPLNGRVTLNGRDIHALNSQSLTREMAILPQTPLAPDGITVGDLVKRGRTPWRGFLSPWSEEDSQACRNALDAVGLADMADCPMQELSGGQRQRVWIALVLAQNAPLLLLDEPTTYLDLVHQIDVLNLFHKRNVDDGLTVISVLHDINLAARLSDTLILQGQYGLVAAGTPEEVITPENLEMSFGLESQVIPDPVTGRPMVVPL